jgi:hypothetical protein
MLEEGGEMKEIEILEKYSFWQGWLNNASKRIIYEKTGCGAVFCASCGVPYNDDQMSSKSDFAAFCAGCVPHDPAEG